MVTSQQYLQFQYVVLLRLSDVLFNALFSTAEAEHAHIQDKHHVSTGCQTEPDRNFPRTKESSAQSEPSPSFTREESFTSSTPAKPHWRLARGRDKAFLSTMSPVVVRTSTSDVAFFKLHDNYVPS